MTTEMHHEIRLDPIERLLIALHRSGMSSSGFAEYVGVHALTASRWFNGHHPMNPAAMRVLAGLAGFEYEWLKPSPDESGKGLGKYAPRDLNPEPTDSWTCLVDAIVSEAESILASADARQRS